MNDLAALLLKNGLSILGTAVAGPLGGAAVDFLAGKLGLSEKTQEAVHEAVSGMKPEQLVDLKKLDVEFQEHMADNGLKLDLADRDLQREQIKTNQIEASQPGFFNGWRPFTGWTCAASLCYVAILEPIARFIAQVIFSYKGAFPVIDTSITLQVLLGLLGLAGLRTREKEKGSEAKR